MSNSGPAEPGALTRRLAMRVVHEVGTGARTAASLHAVLLDASLDPRDNAFVTELAHGTVRMQRACDMFIDKHSQRSPDAEVRALLRIGVYQLVFLGTPPHAAVSATVASARPKVRGFVNAILRRVAEEVATGGEWPTIGDELSYPDWLIDAFISDLGEDDAIEALAAMNDAEQPEARTDGYVQGGSSRAVVAEVGAGQGELVLDMCAAPGGKTTGIAGDGAFAVGLERATARIDQLATTCSRFGSGRASPVLGDATRAPFREAIADRVLVDAPCSGWGALGRRSDARWRVKPGDSSRLARTQRSMLATAAELVKPGGVLIYSVCTTSVVETTNIAEQFSATHENFTAAALVHAAFWREHGTGGLVLPQDHGTDGMAVFRWRREPLEAA